MSSRIVYTPHQSPRTRPLRKVLVLGAASAAVFAAIVGAVYIFRLPSLQIREVEFLGLQSSEERILRERVLAMIGGTYAFILPQSSYFLADRAAVASRLREEFPRLADVEITKEFPDKFVVTASERVFWGIFCSSAAASSTPQCFYIDASGFAYEEAPEVKGSLILSIYSDGAGAAVGRSAVDTATMKLFHFLTEAALKASGTPIIGYELRSHVPSEIRAKVADGFTLIFERDSDFANTFRVLKRVLDEEIKEKRDRLDYIDLRLGNKVFYKLR